MKVEPPEPHSSGGPQQEPNCEPETPARKSRRTLIIGAAAVLVAVAAGSLVESERDRPTGTDVATRPMEMTPTVRLPLRRPGQTPTLVYFVPDDNGQPQKRTAPLPQPLPSDDTQATQEFLATQSLQAFMEEAPSEFPSGTEMKGRVRILGGVPTVNFNRAFADASFWQGSARTLATLDCIAMTVEESKNQLSGVGKEGVQILVEGKPIPTLGEIDLSDPYSPSGSGAGGEESEP